MKGYLNDLHPIRDPLLIKMKDFARQHRIPIMDDTSIKVLESLIQIKQPKKILEIGSAIGYSAIRMAKACVKSRIISYDIDEERLKLAIANAREGGLDERIKFILGDVLAHEDEINDEGPYDFILIDAAKSKYREYFDTFAPMLNPYGVIVCDNVFFRGMVAGTGAQPDKKYRTIVNTLREFNRYIAQHEQFDTTFYPVGDGLAVSIKVR